MAPALNHTIVWCRDKQTSSAFLTDMLSLPPARPFFDFMVVDLSNDVSLDFMEMKGPIAPQHYAFMVNDAEFDAGLAKVKELGLTFWADPHRERPGEINHRLGGRGFYFRDPNGHLLEVLTA